MPQLDLYILSSQILFLVIFFLLYFIFLKYILPVFCLNEKIKNRVLFSFDFKIVTDYLDNNRVLSTKYKHYTTVTNTFDLVSGYIEDLTTTRISVPYSVVRYFILLSIKLDRFRK